jgi:pyridoxal phosphate enzyme (YggS family)
MINSIAFHKIKNELSESNTSLIAVSKTKPVADIQDLYNQGQRIFGENYVQELIEKQPQLPADIQWHFIGHLQSNKVKYIAPFVHTIHAIDSLKLLVEIEKQASKFNRKINCLLQLHVAIEETKFGLNEIELLALINEIEQHQFKFINIIGLMAMASNTDDTNKIEAEFLQVQSIFNQIKNKLSAIQNSFNELSMGMSSDYKIATQCGSTMVRIGSLLFGERN